MAEALHTIELSVKDVPEVRAALGQLGVAVGLLRECLGPLEVAAAVIEDEDGGEAIETLISQVRKFCADAATACGKETGT